MRGRAAGRFGRSARLEQGIEGLDGGVDAGDVDAAHLIELLRISAATAGQGTDQPHSQVKS